MAHTIAESRLLRLWRERDKPGWRNFGVAMAVLALAFILAIYSAAMSESGRPVFAWGSAILALLLAGWVAVTIVPKMARRTSLRWLLYQVDYRLTREGVIYLIAVFVIVLAALNTGNNLLFMMLACLLAGILVSGVVSRAVLTGLDLYIELPEHVFAEQPILATVEIRNEKSITPSFSLRVVGLQDEAREEILKQPVYFPYIPHESSARQKVELLFPRRGVYRQDAFGIRTKFPFGFLEKTRRVESTLELVVYPRVEPTDEFYEILPLLSGEMESMHRGRGHDLYSIRDYLPTDSARFVDWKSSAKTGTLKIREFAREDERRLVLALDPCLGRAASDSEEQLQNARFERAVSLAACIAWHFYETGAVMQFRAPRLTTPMTTADDIVYDILRELAYIEPDRGNSGSDFLASLAEETECFKIILTNHPHGTIPTSLWTSSYFIFLDSL
ncbi:MAG TPA: DUF58 domain-containing protein [Candidatus Acidoferrales bacterium]|nr:DUF58 domain-containing protein [Candidatus Acidoferrales bacterium]